VNAEILSVGTELLLGEIVDTNAQYISARLKSIGVDVYRRVTVGDNPARLTTAFREAMGRASIIVATGGLGPTDDDITAACLAEAIGRRLEFREDAWETILRWFAKSGRTPGDPERKQACIVEGGAFFANRVGTAPGQAVLSGGNLFVLLPGPPSEMIPMFETEVVPLIRKTYPGLVPLVSRSLNLVGIPEARVGEMVKDLMESTNPTVAPYVGLGEVRLRIAARGRGQKESQEMVAQMEEKLRQRLDGYIYGKDEETLEEAVGKLLERKGLTLGVAESVTGGLVCHRITTTPGSSRYFKMGLVAYSPKVKVSCLSVSPKDAEKHDAVNPEVAKSMASGVRDLAGADIGLSTTGFAGPGGGTAEEPLGTVYVGLSYKDRLLVDRAVFPGKRDRVKALGAQRALYCLWKFLKDLSQG